MSWTPCNDPECKACRWMAKARPAIEAKKKAAAERKAGKASK